jgi:uncharacterized repeat protein (TIGR01451 family)
MKRLLQTLLLAPLVLGAARAAAQAPAAAATGPALAVVAENRTAAAEAARGAKRADAKLRPGDVLRYRLTFTNAAERPVRQVRLDNPIPAGLQFVGGSARSPRADARAEYSADGGKTFAPQPVETVVVDGKQLRRPVAPERYTHVRWTVGDWVAPRAAVTAEFEARLPAVAAAKPAVGADAKRGG